MARVNDLHRDCQRVQDDVKEVVSNAARLKEYVDGVKENLQTELANVRAVVQTKISSTSALSALEKTAAASVAATDWKMALGELSMNLRREITDKIGREELYSTVRGEVEILDKRVLVRHLHDDYAVADE